METDTVVTERSNAGTRTQRLGRVSRRLLGGLAVLAIGSALTLSVAQAHGGGGPGGAGGGMFGGGPGGGFMAFRMNRVLDRAGASEAQKAQIKTIWEGLQPQLKAVHEQHRQLHQQLTQAMTAPNVDTAAVERLRQQGVALLDKTSGIVTQGLVQTANVLTPEQRKTIAAEMAKRHEGGHEGGHHGRGGHDGAPDAP
jgi:periplasmic protein CpxP/Spy